RIGFFMPKAEDTWWEINEDTSSSLLSAEINAVIWSCALPFLRQFETENDIKNYLRGATSASMKLNYPHALQMLEFDLMEYKSKTEIDKAVNRARFLGKIS